MMIFAFVISPIARTGLASPEKRLMGASYFESRVPGHWHAQYREIDRFLHVGNSLFQVGSLRLRLPATR